MISVFSRVIGRAASAWTVLVMVSLALGGCAANSSAWQSSSMNPSNWFAHASGKTDGSQISPDVSHLHGPLAPPQPAPRVPVLAAPVAPSSTTLSATNKVKVAILLPLSGGNAALGLAMLNAAQQAVFDVADSRFELMPRDTGSGETGADTAARDALVNGAKLFIGPLFAANIPVVRAVAQSAHINMLTLSTDTSFAAPGVYVMGFAPGAQVERVIGFAASRGLHRFAALVPNNAYGTLVGQAFQLAVTRNGGMVMALETYDPQRHDSDVHIHNLATHRDQMDALFLPEGGNDLNLIASQLSGAGFDPHVMHVLGTGLWDVPDLGHQAGNVIGGWYAASDPASRQNFINTYISTYGAEPPRLVTLAYDATALAAVLAKRNAPFDAASLTNPNGFAGLDGIFRLTPQGLTERGLAVIEVTPDGTRMIDAAPKTFATGG